MVKDLITMSLAITPVIIIGIPIFLFLIIGYFFMRLFPFIIKKSFDWWNDQVENYQSIFAISFSFLIRIFVFDQTYGRLIQLLMKHHETFFNAFNTSFSLLGHYNVYLQIAIIGFFFIIPIKNLFFHTLNVLRNNKSKKYIAALICMLILIGLLCYFLLYCKAFPEKYATQIILYIGLTSLSILCSFVLIVIFIGFAYILNLFFKKN